jgi:transcriptional regulator with XRE-family HTH domain
MAHQFSGSRLRDARRQTGLSREQLAVRAGISMSALCSYEQGRVIPTVNTGAALAEVLGVDLGELLYENGPLLRERDEPARAAA